MVLSLIPAPLRTSPFPLMALRIGDAGGPITIPPPPPGLARPLPLSLLVADLLIEEGGEEDGGKREDNGMTGWGTAARCGLIGGVVR